MPENIERFVAMPDGSIWASGSSVAVFDGETWSGREEPYKAVTPDGTMWLVTGREGLVSWDGETFTTHRPSRFVRSLLVDTDGNIWAVGDGIWSYDGETWTQHLKGRVVRQLLLGPEGKVWAAGRGIASWDGQEWTRHLKGQDIDGLSIGPDGKLVAVGRRKVATFDGNEWTTLKLPSQRNRTPDGARWRVAGNTIERVLDGKRRRFRTGGQINEMAIAPDGSVWVIGAVSHRENGGVFRIRTGNDSE